MHNEESPTMERNYKNCAVCGAEICTKEWFIPFNYKAICRDCCKELANLFWCKETDEALKQIEELGRRSASLLL